MNEEGEGPWGSLYRRQGGEVGPPGGSRPPLPSLALLATRVKIWGGASAPPGWPPLSLSLRPGWTPIGLPYGGLFRVYLFFYFIFNYLIHLFK
jgi:hypothetical protein